MLDMAGKTMNAFCYEGYDGVLKKVDIPVPVPKEGEILVKVEAVSVNPCDWKIQSGLMKPSLPKFPCVTCKIYSSQKPCTHARKNFYDAVTDIAGEIVSDLKPDKNGLAEYVVAPANQAAKLPQEVAPVEASGLPVAATTALKALQLVGTKFDGTGKPLYVLVTAASGGVGLYAVQLAKLANLHVTATCGPRNIDLVKSLGADEVLDYQTPKGESLKSPGSNKYDVVIYGSGGIAWSVFKPNLSENGEVIDLSPDFANVVSSSEETTFPKKQLFLKNYYT